MGLARMGALVNFISHTVVVGFTAGAGLLIMSTQLSNFLGIPMPRGISFAETLHQALYGLDEINWYVASVGMITLLVGMFVKRRYRRLPYMIIAMIAGSLYAALLGMIPQLDAREQIETVQALSGIFPQFSMPDFSLESLRKTASIAVALTMLGLTEAVSIARAIAVRSEQRIDGNQEFIGQGLSNIAGSFFSAYASSGSFNRSGVNYEAGARTPLAAVLSAVFLLLIVLLVAPLVQFLPVPTMAGILLMGADRPPADPRHRPRQPVGKRRARRDAAGNAVRPTGVRDLCRHPAVADALPQAHIPSGHSGRQAGS
jgi:SulP family sulfate permease